MVIIQPASWLIDVRKPEGKNKNAPVFDSIKSRLGNHVYKVVIENLNKEFDTAMYVPFSITYIDLNQEFGSIDFWCCGEHRVVDNLYDCNMIGDYNMIWSILNKIKSYGEKVGTMKDHIYKPGKSITNQDTHYCKFNDIVGCGGISFSGSNQGSKVEVIYDSDGYWRTHQFGTYMMQFTIPFYLTPHNSISNCFHYTKKPGGSKEYTDKLAYQLYGTKQELENWKHFVFNNKIPLFTSIVLIISQNNRVKDIMPWITDKQYTDNELYEMLGINEDEQKFIDRTIQKYERHSPWFRRYMCGKKCVLEEEI